MNTRILTATAIAGVMGLTAAAGMWLLDDDGMPNGDTSTIAPEILGAPDGTVLASGLVQATDCTDLAATMEELAAEYGQFAYGGGRMAVDMMAVEEMAADGMATDDGAAGFDTGAPAPTAGEAQAATEAGDTGGFDATNVQEVGVDEPDIVERVGQDMVVVGTEGTLRVVDVSGGTPVERGSLAVQEWGGDLGLFAVGPDRVAVIAQGEGVVREDLTTSMIRPGGWGTTVVTLVDISDPSAPRQVSRMEVEGWMVDARAVDGVLRLAVRSEGPQIDVQAMGEFDIERSFDWETATQEDHERYEREYQAEFERRMQEARAQLEPAHWQPHADIDGRTVPLVGCDRIGFPTSFAGMGTLTMAAIDATGDSLAIDDAEAVVTSGENLYATTDRVVIATTRWDVPEPLPTEPEPLPPPEEEPTFEPGEPAPPVDPDPLPEPTAVPLPEPVPTETEPSDPSVQPEPSESPEQPVPTEGASAEAEVLSMVDPAMGMIAPPGWGFGGTTDLHVFDVEGTVVSHVASGSVEGSLLNQYSMSIHDGVLRTATTGLDEGGSESYVTTFRVEGTDLVQIGQVGGLGPDEDIQAVRFMGTTAYVVTFRRTDPLYVVDLTDPANPQAKGELKIEGYSAYLHPLGAGQLLGVGQDADPETGITRGTQVSTFDVADPTRPERIDVDVTPDSSSEVEWEPHALTVTADRHAIVPIEIWNEGPDGRLGALVYRIADSGELSRLGMLNTGSDWHLRPRRAIDLGDVLLTVGERGVVTWDRATFQVGTTLRFDPPSFENGIEDPARDTPGGRGEPGFDDEG